MTAAATTLAFACPACRADLAAGDGGHRCAPCGREYPTVAGIPDFRLAPDPWISIEDDRAKALRLAEVTRHLPFDDAVRAYWAMTPTTPASQAARFTTHVLDAEARSRAWLDAIGTDAAGTGPWLDLGCGTGDLLAAADGRGVAVVGADIALRWLVVARRRPSLAHASLVCCGAEALPLRPATFTRVFSLGMLEHAGDAAGALREARRVLAPGGVLRLRTVNRFSLLREPHVGVWGVGFLPRRWADRYVRALSGRRYQFHRPLSRRELARGLTRAGFVRPAVGAAAPLPAETARLAPAARAGAALLARLARGPLAAPLGWVAPLLEARAEAPAGGSP